MFEITTDSNDCRMAEATIRFNGMVIGYVGGSSHESTVREVAEDVVNGALQDFFAPVIERIQGNRDVVQASRFDTGEDDDPPKGCPLCGFVTGIFSVYRDGGSTLYHPSCEVDPRHHWPNPDFIFGKPPFGAR